MSDKKITVEMFEKALQDWKIRKKMVQAQCESCWSEEAELAIVALEKQIPKKVIDIHVDEYYCPVCGAEHTGGYDALNSNSRIDKYCPECGQALDWSK